MTEDKEQYTEWYAELQKRLAIAQSTRQHPLADIINLCVTMHKLYEEALGEGDQWTHEAAYFSGARTAYAAVLDVILTTKEQNENDK